MTTDDWDRSFSSASLVDQGSPQAFPRALVEFPSGGYCQAPTVDADAKDTMRPLVVLSLPYVRQIRPRGGGH